MVPTCLGSLPGLPLTEASGALAEPGAGSVLTRPLRRLYPRRRGLLMPALPPLPASTLLSEAPWFCFFLPLPIQLPLCVGTGPPQVPCASLTTSLQGGRLPCPREGLREGRRLGHTGEAHTAPGIFYLSRWWLLRWSKVCFHYLIRRIFIIKRCRLGFPKNFFF